MFEVLVSLDEAAAICNSQHLAVVRVLYDFHPQSPYELRLLKVRCRAYTFPYDQFYQICQMALWPDAHSLALPAMGHWDTCPIDFQLLNFSDHFRAARTLTFDSMWLPMQ